MRTIGEAEERPLRLLRRVLGAGLAGVCFAALLFLWERSWYQSTVLHPPPTAKHRQRMENAVKVAFGSKVRIRQMVWVDTDIYGLVATVTVPGGIDSLRSSPATVSRGAFALYDSPEVALGIEGRAGVYYCYQSTSLRRVEKLRRDFLAQNSR